MACVLVIGDTHCPGMLKGYPAFLKQIYNQWGCNRVVHIGDLMDWAAISYHEKNPSISDAETEYKLALSQVKKLARAFPKADWLIGNHDCLTVRKAHSAGLPAFLLKEYTKLWEIPNWTAHPRYSRIEIDGVIYTHGDQGKGGMYSSVKNSRDNFQSWVQGHNHSEAGVWYTVNHNKRIFGLNTGCGMDHKLLQFEYGKKFNKKPAIGCGVVIDGRYAYFEPMLL